MGKRVRLKEGDLFHMPLSDGRFGFGQVTHPGVVFHIIVFPTIRSGQVDPETIDTHEILLCGWTTDALFFHDEWHVIANAPVRMSDVPLPWSKVRMDDRWFVQNFEGRPVREASPVEAEHLEYHSSFSPRVFVHALEVHVGLIPKDSQFDRVSVETRRNLAAICSG